MEIEVTAVLDGRTAARSRDRSAAVSDRVAVDGRVAVLRVELEGPILADHGCG